MQSQPKLLHGSIQAGLCLLQQRRQILHVRMRRKPLPGLQNSLPHQGSCSKGRALQQETPQGTTEDLGGYSEVEDEATTNRFSMPRDMQNPPCPKNPRL